MTPQTTTAPASPHRVHSINWRLTPVDHDPRDTDLTSYPTGDPLAGLGTPAPYRSSRTLATTHRRVRAGDRDILCIGMTVYAAAGDETIPQQIRADSASWRGALEGTYTAERELYVKAGTPLSDRDRAEASAWLAHHAGVNETTAGLLIDQIIAATYALCPAAE